MIINLSLQDALHERPSKSQLLRTIVGNKTKLCYNDAFFWVKVVFIHGDDLVGIVINDDEHEFIKKGDLLSFQTKNIIEVLHDNNTKKIKPFMLLTHFESQNILVLNWMKPRFIAEIIMGDVIKAELLCLIDEPVNYQNEVEYYLKKISNWYFYNYVIDK